MTTLLGSLHCRTDVQLADGKALLLKYVSSYVTKMHESATSEGLYCTDVTGYQAAHSFLRTVTPLEPEMVFQLSNIKVCWTDKFTVLFRPPFPDQTEGNKVYKMYLEHPQTEDDQTLLQWLTCHQTSGSKPKPYANDRVLVGVKYVSIFNPIFFFQHLTMNFPHREFNALRHTEEDMMPDTIKHFAQSVALTPQYWDTADTITTEFEQEGHKSYFLNTIMSYVQSLHDILHLWRIRVLTNEVGDLSSLSLQSLYPLSPHQSAILADITAALSSRQSLLSQDNHSDASDSTWQKYRLLLGKPGTGKSQVLIRAIDYATRHELSVLVATPVALLAQGYNSILYEDVTTDTLHGAFNIPIDGPLPNEINHRINHYDMIVVDEASMISAPIFRVMASTFNRMNVRPVVVLPGDKCQQQPLQTVNGRVTSTTSIIKDNATFSSNNAVIHRLHQQFRIDSEYAAFLDIIWFIRPTQEQVNKMQDRIVLCPEGQLTDRQIWTAFQSHPNSTVMTVSRKGAQRINTIVVGQLFQGRPLTNIPCACVADSQPIYPHRNMREIFTENRDKAACVVNGQAATIISSQNNTIILRLPEGQQVFVYPVTHIEDDALVTRYPFTPSYAQTIIKAQGQNIQHLIIWLDSALVPVGTAYVGLSRVRRKSAISLLQPIYADQLTPVQL